MARKPKQPPLPPEKRGVGKPPHKPSDETRRTVEIMTACGVEQKFIMRVLEISKPTLRKHYRKEIDTGLPLANARMGAALFQNGVKNNNIAAQIYWMKTRGGAGWREVVELGNADGKPLAVSFTWAKAAEPMEDYEYPVKDVTPG